jgi:hypothetical protein
LSPIPCPKNAYALISVSKPDSKHLAVNISKAEEALFLVVTVFKVATDDSIRVIKGILSFLERNAMFLLICCILVLIPFK